jgi:hypothetical protein
MACRLTGSVGRPRGRPRHVANARATAATARSTSTSVVFRLHTETRIHLLPRHVVPPKPMFRVGSSWRIRRAGPTAACEAHPGSAAERGR